MGTKTVKIEDDLWAELHKLRVDMRSNSLNAVLNKIVRNYFNQKKQNEKKQEIDQS